MQAKSLSNFSAARMQRQQEEIEGGQSRVPTEASSYQSGEDCGRGYSSLLNSQHSGFGLVPSEQTSPSQDQVEDHFCEPTTLPGTSGVQGTRRPTERLVACHRYSRIVRALAVFDALLILGGTSAFTPLILMIWGPIAGFVSSNFRIGAAYTFLFYYGLRVSWDMGWLLSGGVTWIVVWVFLFTDVAALGLVYFYLGLLRRCTADEVEQLRDPSTAQGSSLFLPCACSARSRVPSIE